MRSKTITVRLPHQTYLILKQVAEREADSISDFIRSTLDDRFMNLQEAERLEALETRLVEKLDENRKLVIQIARFLKRNF